MQKDSNYMMMGAVMILVDNRNAPKEAFLMNVIACS